MKKTDLSKYDNSWYSTGKIFFTRSVWYLVNAIFFISPILHSNKIKLFWLKIFGAKLGKNVIIKPSVNIKYPWNLTIGNNTWIGERVWVDNLVKINIGNNVCISQGAMLLTGNHNYKKETFDLIVGEIILEDGVWIGAKAIVCPGIICKTHSVLSVNSVAVADLESNSIYQGNPAVKIKDRIIE